MSPVLKKFKTDIFGVIWFAIGVFILLSLVSYNSLDPSFNTSSEGQSLKNYCGYFGSFLSDALYQLFGLSSWVLVFGAFRKSYFSFIGKETQFSKYRLMLLGFLLIVVASLASLYFPVVTLFSHDIKSGGVIGLILSKGLVLLFNEIGVSIILWSALAVLTIFYWEKSLSDIAQLPGRLISALPWKSATQSLIDRSNKIIEDIKAKKEESKLVPIEPQMGKKQEFIVDDNEDYEEEYEDEPEEETSRLMSLIKRDTQANKPKKLKMERRHVANWELPKIDMLSLPPQNRVKIDDKTIQQNIKLLEDKLHQFSVRGKIVAVKPGPAVTLYEFRPAPDVKISKITELADDLSLALSAESVRIIAPVPGRDVVGIETSNPERDTVYIREVLEDQSFWSPDKKLPITLGKAANGEPSVVDLRKLPHMMVAGSTGSGKSVFVISTLTSLLFKHSPKTLKLLLVDPKQVDLAVFHKVPHLIMPPVKDTKKAVIALKWAIREMDKRYRSMSEFGARDIEGFNEKVTNLNKEEFENYQRVNEELADEGKKRDCFYYEPQPYMVIVIEEFGDLMAVDRTNVEQAVVRLAQMARACGIHLILAMQSPRKDVVTGLIKTNIPGRISFKVASKMDSRIILDESGAERLLARGDMLFLAPGVSKPERNHGPWIPEDEVSKVSRFWSEQSDPDFDEDAMAALDGSGGGFDLAGGDFDDQEDEKDDRYYEILDFVQAQKEVSASLLQRKFRLGYPRAARMIEIFEQEGIVGPPKGSKPREVLLNS